MLVEPDTIPPTMPEPAPTVATPVLLLLQVPPVKPGALRLIVAPAHTAVGPMIDGTGLSVMIALPFITFVQPVHEFVATTL